MVPRPLLVNGIKVDLRTYVLVTGWGSGSGGGGLSLDSGSNDGLSLDSGSNDGLSLGGGGGGGGEGRGSGSGGGGGVDDDTNGGSGSDAHANAHTHAHVRVECTPETKPTPIRAYLYDEGLVRFAATAFDPVDTSAARHLTNNALVGAMARGVGVRA